MNKQKRHEKAEEFRRQIVLPMQRNAVITGFLNKDSFDESDRLKLVVLFQKASYLKGCEHGYRELVAKIKDSGDTALIEKTVNIAKKLHI